MRLPQLTLPRMALLLSKVGVVASGPARAPFPAPPAGLVASTPSPASPPSPRHAPPSKEKREDDPRPPVEDALDPLARHAAQWAPPMMVGAVPPSPVSLELPPQARISLEELLPQLVRKLALAGDGKRATVRVEIGAGALSGATLVVSNETGGIRVDIEAPAGVDRDAWSSRIRARLEAKGLRVDDVRIT